MAYAKDADAMTRGVGAIAARDVGNRNRQVLRAQQARMTRLRDRSMAVATYGPRGGMGAVANLDIWMGPPAGSGPIEAPTKLYGGSGSLPLPVKYGPAISTTASASDTSPMYQSPPIMAPTVTMKPPIMAPTVTMKPPIVMPTNPGVMVGPAVPPSPPTFDKKWLLIGAAGLAAYFLFFDKGGSSST